jgi:hypothetical protein
MGEQPIHLESIILRLFLESFYFVSRFACSHLKWYELDGLGVRPYHQEMSSGIEKKVKLTLSRHQLILFKTLQRLLKKFVEQPLSRHLDQFWTKQF